MAKQQLKKLMLIFPYFKFYFLRKELKYTSHVKFSEAQIIHTFFKYFSKTKVMIDVGAHYGESFAPYEKDGWKIFAFEPDPENRKRIKPQLQSTEIFDMAVTEVDGQELILYKSEESTGISSLASFHHTHKPTTKVKTKNLNAFCKERNIHKIDFLKIDTEGYDLFVLKGFPFERIKPLIILCEFEDNKTVSLEYTYRDLGSFLISKGYNVFISEWHPIIKYGIQHTWRSINKFTDQQLADKKAWGNFIGVRSDFPYPFKFLIGDYLHSLKANN